MRDYRYSTRPQIDKDVKDDVGHSVFKGSPDLFCRQNPYAHKLADSMETITQRMDTWLAPKAYDAMLHQAQTNETWKIKWNAFEPFSAMTSCKANEKSCIGGPCRKDTSKIACGVNAALQPGCIIYSIGGNNQWEFEQDVLQKTPCEVHTFDCTGPRTRFRVPEHDRLHFHHICIGTTEEPEPVICPPRQKRHGFKKCGATKTLLGVQQMLGHSQIDLYKMDIEGYEVPIFQSWPELTSRSNANGQKGEETWALPMQLLVEVHYLTQFEDLWKPGQNSAWEPFMTPVELVQLQRHLINMGYVVIERDDNKLCPHCTELTLVRMRCPQSSKISSES